MVRRSNPSFYAVSRFRAQGERIGRLNIYGEIDAQQFWGDEVTPNRMLEELEGLGDVDRLDVHVFSNGGDVFAGLAIYRLLRQRAEPVHVYIEGIAASIATVIACGGDVVYIGDTDMMMVHDPSTFLCFESINAQEARDIAEELDSIRRPMIAAYTAKTGRSAEEVIAVMDGPGGKGTWFTAAEAIEFGLADDYTPDAKRPREMAARIRPAVLDWRGHTVDMSRYPGAAKYTARVCKQRKGVLSMAFKSKKKTAKTRKRGYRAELDFVEMVCPHCGAAVLLNPETAEVALVGVEDGGETELEVSARRHRGSGKRRHRAHLFNVTCPSCDEEFVWDTEQQDDGEEGEAVVETVEVGEDEPEEFEEPEYTARRRGKTAQKRKFHHARRRTRAEVSEAFCPNCSTVVMYTPAELELYTDENGIEGYALTCPECGTEFLEPVEESIPEAIPTDAPSAYRAGIMAERRRMLALDEMAGVAPGCEEMIQTAKRTGVSADAMTRNVFKAIKKNPALAGQQHRAALERDVQAAGLNGMKMPQHHSPQNGFVGGVLTKLDDR